MDKTGTEYLLEEASNSNNKDGSAGIITTQLSNLLTWADPIPAVIAIFIHLYFLYFAASSEPPVALPLL